MDGEGMVCGDDTVLKIMMPEEKRVAIGIIAPGGRRIGIPPVVRTAEDPVRPAVTGGLAVGTGPCGYRGAIPTQHEGLEVTEEAALDGGEDPTGEEEVFQAGEQLLGPELVSRSEQLLGQALSDGIGLPGIPSLRRVPVGLFLLEMASMPPLAQAARPHVVGTGRRIRAIFKPVKKGIEGADRGRLEGREASDLREAWVGPQVVRPLRQTFVVEEEHQEESAEQTDGIAGRPPAWSWGIERTEQRPGRVEVELEEHEGGLVPRLRQAAGLATEPALQLLGQGLAILSMR
jgi:hypothetical protein